MTPEDTPRMAERTDRQPDQSWLARIRAGLEAHDRGDLNPNADMFAWESVAYLLPFAALLRERDAQIASLTAQVEQQTQGYTLKGLSNYFGWGLESDRDVWQFAASREHTLRLAQELLETSRSDAGTAADAIRDRIDTLRAERDAAQQERDSIAKQLHAEVMSERERRVAAQEGITLKYVPELEAAQQENQTLREALKAAWCELIQHDDQPWVKTLAGQVRVVGLFASPRPQESQP